MTLTQEALHFFTGVAFDLMPDTSYTDLEELSQLARYNERIHHYAAAREALQKVQWAKISAMQAVSVEQEIIAQYKPGVLSLHLPGRVQHAKSLFELVAHAKSALDSLSVCLNDVHGLGIQGGERDLKWPRFRSKVSNADNVLGEILARLKPWFDKSNNTCRSISALRDYWIHIGAPSIPQLYPPTGLGALPVPIAIPWSFNEIEHKDYDKLFWDSRSFTEYHIANLEAFFNATITSCIAVERKLGNGQPITHSTMKTSFLTLLATEAIRVGKMTLIH